VRGVGIPYETFQSLQSHTSVRGSIFIEGAPVGAPICSLYDTEIKRDLIDGRYECFKDHFGKWLCANASGWRIVDTSTSDLTME
jgi:hypothetical protein